MAFTDGIDIGQERADQGTIGRFDDEEGGFLCFLELFLPLVPGSPHLVGLICIECYVHSSHMRGERAGVRQALDRRAVQLINRYHEAMVDMLRLNGAIRDSFPLHMLIVAM